MAYKIFLTVNFFVAPYSKNPIFATQFPRRVPKTWKLPAGVAKLVDALDLGSNAARHGGSSPSTRTKPLP